MNKLRKQQLWLAVSCLAGVVVALSTTHGLEETEFSGGWLTGPLLSMANAGAGLFMLALVVTFWRPRIAGAVGLASSLLCLPLYLYFVAPVPFAQIFAAGHEFSTQPKGGFHWDPWAIAGILTVAVSAWVCVRALRSPIGDDAIGWRGESR